ncbi:MAG: NRAMP family divalent metal transporter [Pyrinomonadaceae bacterium]
MKRTPVASALLGAAFLMATSAVGPGFLTQTAVFTGQLLGSFGFVILLSVVLDIFAQLNIWRVLTVSGKRAQDVANETIRGSGYLLAALVVFGGLVFNIGNIAGCGLGLNALAGIRPEYGAAASAAVAIAIFVVREAGRAMDLFVKLLGVLMIGLIVYVVVASGPPLGDAALKTVWPDKIDARAIVTLVGGTVGGYITFAGAHRLIDAGIVGRHSLRSVDRGAVTGIALTAVIRALLFLAAFGVIYAGSTLDAANPPASVFRAAAGDLGSRMFGVVMWAAAITSVVGAAYTSISFLKTLHPRLEKHNNAAVIVFIVVSAAVFLAVGRPVQLLIWAGTVNGFILPVGLSIVLLAARQKKITGEYRHPVYMSAAGWLVVLLMGYFSVRAVVDALTASR